eukprot:2587714-Amphidinium_carterae.1
MSWHHFTAPCQSRWHSVDALLTGVLRACWHRSTKDGCSNWCPSKRGAVRWVCYATCSSSHALSFLAHVLHTI